MDPTEAEKRFSEFISTYSKEFYEASRKTSFVIDFSDIDKFDPPLADMLLERPKETIDAFNNSVKSKTDKNILVRIRNLPESRFIPIRHLRSEHLNRLWDFDAVVKSATEVKPLIDKAIFECPECTNRITIKQEGSLLRKPDACECGRRGDFEMVDKINIDTRMIKVNDPFELVEGEQPGELAVMLKNDMTTPRMQIKTDPGKRIKITGMLKELPVRLKGKLSTKLDTLIEANYVESGDIASDDLMITPEEENNIIEMSKDVEVFNKLKASVAPGIFGFEEIKESVLLQMFGGSVHTNPDGSRTRGNIHILLTGDPGVGKTVLMKVMTSMVPRGKYVSGSGVTGAGLTATVRKDEALGSWVLEAGALILCNKSMISIDEFDKMSKDDQIAMHEAMSIETVSIAKASIVATLPAETAVLAGANPELGRFDQYRSITEQIKIPETLLSRFDLKFALRDIPKEERDIQLAEHITKSRTNPESVEPIVSSDMIKKYVAYAKKNIEKIHISPEASDMLKNFYIKMRGSNTGENAAVAITLRQYEALIRLSEASARVRLSDTATKEDAERAIRLMEFSLSQLGFDSETGQFDIDKIESGITKNKRNKMSTMIQLIESLQKQPEAKQNGGVNIETLIEQAKEAGIDDPREVISNLRIQGTIFEPKHGFVRKV